MADGKVITFYSYKGGTGRSMALANVAWVLALNGKRVLTIDWDLEAPGLHRYYLPFLNDPELLETSGLIDLFWSYTNIILTPREAWPPGITDPMVFANAQRYAVPLEFPFPDSSGCIHLLGAGRQDTAYANRIRSFDWHAFYERLGGGQFIETFSERSRQQYDYVLIDSRTGVADTSGICTVQMPNAVVLCFTYNRQSLRGVEAVAKSIKAQRGKSIKLFPIAMRADRAVKGYEQAKRVARELLEPLLDFQFDNESLERYWGACEVPYYPDYALEENLSILNDLPGQRNTLLNDMVWLAETIDECEKGSLIIPELDAVVREKYRRRFALRDPRLSQLTEILELPSADAYSRLNSLIVSSGSETDDRAWLLALAKSLDSVTDKLRSQGLSEQAVAAGRDGIGVLTKVYAADREAHQLLASSLSKLAIQLEAIGRSHDALIVVDEAIQHYQTLSLELPELSSNLANVLSKRGAILAAMGQWQESLDATLLAVSEYAKLAANDADTFEPDLAGCLINLGQVYNALRDPKKSLEVILRASSIYEHLAAKNPDTFEVEWARSLSYVANRYEKNRQPTEALRTALQAAQIYEVLATKSQAAFEPNLAMGITGKDGKYYELNASGAQLSNLPEDVGKLPHLRRLDLSNNQLQNLPKVLTSLGQLNYLNISANRLTAFPDVVFNLNKLQYLNASTNELAVIPGAVTQLRQLKDLNLSRNRLKSVPDFLGQLAKLQVLNLSNNAITTLPESLCYLNDLKTLEISDNRLSSLPQSLGQLTQLQELRLDGNKLTNLPESLLNLTRLEILRLRGNNALSLPAEILGSGGDEPSVTAVTPAEILKYYFRTRGGEKRPLNEAKLILVGRGAVGKTSIVNRLIHGTFTDEKKTEGIKITEWPLTVGENRDDVRLNVWDFGGQEIMHATHQFFLTERSLYLLVLSGRDGVEDADAEYWLKLIQSFGGDSPVVVVLNKFKEYPFDVNRNALQRKYPFIRDFIKTDCADATGIEELRGVVERETDKLEHLRDAFPASWFSIKDKLAGMKRNYLSFEEYRKECAELGEKDTEAQDSLAFHLHNLGIALNYKDDTRLKDTHVLNPHWVTSGIYNILNATRLEKQKGEISLKDLPSILDRKEYPAEVHWFLLDLMRKFEMCFSLDGKEGVYLIPELLDKQQPSEADEFDPAECLNFQYHYPVLPEGLLPRFVVRTHVLSDETQRWRTGVILKLEDDLALVRADAQERRVLINIKGPVAGRRRLLSIIRANLDRIHGSIRNLKPIEIVPLPEQPDSYVPYVELLAWEESGKREFDKVIEGRIVTLSVQRLLNGVETEGERASASGLRPSHDIERRRAARVFVSYSHKDERQLNELKTHLSPLERLKLIETWYDRRIVAGEDFGQKINENLESADIILLIVSADFIASKYCYEIEMKRALERHEKKEARVVPVIVRDVNWKVIPELSKLEALPKSGKPVPKWPRKDEAWHDVAERVQAILEAMRDAAPFTRRAR